MNFNEHCIKNEHCYSSLTNCRIQYAMESIKWSRICKVQMYAAPRVFSFVFN